MVLVTSKITITKNAVAGLVGQLLQLSILQELSARVKFSRLRRQYFKLHRLNNGLKSIFLLQKENKSY